MGALPGTMVLADREPETIVQPQRSLWIDAWHRAIRNPFTLISALVIIGFLLAASIGPSLSPYSYTEQDLLNSEQGPSAEHWFGTDELGRDFLSRILYGARTAFLVATMVTVIGGSMGVLLGATAALTGGKVGALIMRTTDVLMSFPHLLLAVFVNATLRPRVQQLFAWLYDIVPIGLLKSRLVTDYLIVFGALAVVSWPGIARLVRGQVLSLREAEFVDAARAAGAEPRWIILRHLVPNIAGPVIVTMTVSFGGAMMLESSLSYLGVGIQPPGASWGAMISENIDMWRYKPHLVLVPGGVLAVVIFAFNFFGDGLNDALNPQNRRR